MPRCTSSLSRASCFDCGSTEEDGKLQASRYGGDPVCVNCEATRVWQARTYGIFAVALDPSALFLHVKFRGQLPMLR